MIDFEAEGLLDGVDGEARVDRLALLEQLAGEGMPLEELREAVAAGRLTLLPVERALAGDGGAIRRGGSLRSRASTSTSCSAPARRSGFPTRIPTNAAQ